MAYPELELRDREVSTCWHIAFLLQGQDQHEQHFDPRATRTSAFRCVDVQVHTMMEESATACLSGDFAQALEKAKEAVSTASPSVASLL